MTFYLYFYYVFYRRCKKKSWKSTRRWNKWVFKKLLIRMLSYRPQTFWLFSLLTVQYVLLVWYYVCVCFTAQPQLPRGETALRVPAQQVGPHQAANSWFWPAQRPGLVLRAQHTTSLLISIENAASNQEGVSNWLLFNTPSVTASTTAPHPPLFLPFSFSHHPSSFLPSFSDFLIPLASLLPAILKISLWLYPHLFAFFVFFLNELLWNFIPLDQWKGLPACVKGFGDILQHF